VPPSEKKGDKGQTAPFALGDREAIERRFLLSLLLAPPPSRRRRLRPDRRRGRF
jgi:hypothetical protein